MCNPSFSPSSSSSFDPLSSSSSSSYSYSNDHSYSGRRFRKPSLRSMSGLGLGTTQARKSSSLFFDDAISNHEEPHYFLDSCFLCKTPLHAGDDIYMYRGDTPFCSEDCRQEQIEIDEAKERNKKKVSKKKLKNDNTSKSQSHELHVIASENY